MASHPFCTTAVCNITALFNVSFQCLYAIASVGVYEHDSDAIREYKNKGISILF